MSLYQIIGLSRGVSIEKYKMFMLWNRSDIAKKQLTLLLNDPVGKDTLTIY